MLWSLDDHAHVALGITKIEYFEEQELAFDTGRAAIMQIHRLSLRSCATRMPTLRNKEENFTIKFSVAPQQLLWHLLDLWGMLEHISF